ncbi:hypothetical protein [Paracoccus saliphilus]|uniref:Uncharacterized protein n=1 Tax=Paracoccus saliphilus TaxID=405559 RepID=A0AA46A4I3_9RHOB|nr:hypothetical protein [Paracoccus saliphilus]WCR01812.1 hypothetical protein JHX88_12870 [Paracoccus saliphilus]SIS63708.1 hypothetical protein SAMN05421772_102165 [Paracoccus saliphilus]
MSVEAEPFRRGFSAPVAQGCICLVIAVSLIEIFAPIPVLGLIGGAALALYFLLSWRRLTLIGAIPITLSLVMLILAVLRDVPLESFIHAFERACFLASLLALLGMLRIAASAAPEIERAGRYVTAQPPGRRYLALNFGGHVFGMLINLGGLAILLDMAARAMGKGSAHLPPDLQRLKLRRMTLAVTRGFGLVALWSPLAFSVNSLLLSMPDLDYLDVGPIGFVLAFVVAGYGWLLDRRLAPKGRNLPHGAAPPDPADRGAVGLLLAHLGLLGGAVIALSSLAPVSFQQALLLVLPSYAVLWMARTGRRATGKAMSATGRMIRDSLRSFGAATSELGVFASGGLLSVLVIAVLPVEEIRALTSDLGMTPVAAVWAISLTMFLSGCVGINPIISASVLGSLVSQLDIAGLATSAAALTLMGTWAAVMCFSPFITTVAYAGALIGQSPVTVGMRWNWPYSIGLLLLWNCGMSLAVHFGLL